MTKQIVVVGGGVAGVCTAFFLARAGLEAVVIERSESVAQGSSFAHSGLVAPVANGPLGGPGTRRRLLLGLLGADTGISVRPGLDRKRWQWLRDCLYSSETERYRVNRARAHRIAAYGQALLQQLREHYLLEYGRTLGALHLLRTPSELAQVQPLLALLADQGVPHALLEPDQARLVEPGLSPQTAFTAGLHLSAGETGNCALFTKRLKQVAETLGVRFHFAATVNQIEATPAGVALLIDGKRFPADAVVVAAGNDSARLLEQLGLALPLHSVQALSITAMIRNYDLAPHGAVIDEAHKVTITRLGGRVRVTGPLAAGMDPQAFRRRAHLTLSRIAGAWFPQAAQFAEASQWHGSVALLPDDVPLLGPTPVRHVFVNTGHGSGGWATAVGAGKAIADIISGSRPEIDFEELTLKRYG